MYRIYNLFMQQLKLNISNESEVKVIASSAFSFRIELILSLGEDDLMNIYNISKNLAKVFGNNFLLDKDNVLKYFNENTLPFVARYKGEIIGYIIGVPIEFFRQESWVRYDNNLGKDNTIYTYAFVMNEKYRKVGGYSKTLKRIYLNWAKKNGYKFCTGHVKQGITKNFSSKTEIIKTFPNWYGTNSVFEYYRRFL